MLLEYLGIEPCYGERSGPPRRWSLSSKQPRAALMRSFRAAP